LWVGIGIGAIVTAVVGYLWFMWSFKDFMG
jgi:hypothetical protein